MAAKRPSRRDELETVRKRLQAYADRGVFRGYSERPTRSGRHYFRFLWLGRDAFTFTYEPASGTLTFTNVLPHIRVRSALYQALKCFIEDRSARRLPAHRRIDPRRARASCSSRRGTMLIHVVAKPGSHAYGVTKAVNLVHEIFLYLQGYFPEYLWEYYDVAEE